jgi:exopolysaccharide production protein ExoZ
MEQKLPAPLGDIQMLRGVAAFLVVIAHIFQDLSLRGGYAAPSAFAGRYGVDIFFVISGFIMVHSTTTKHHTITQFWANRGIRIVPIYWIATLATVALVQAVPALFKTTTINVEYVIKSLLFIPYERPSGVMQPILFVGWSLNFEMFFYAIFGLALIFPGMAAYLACMSVFLMLVVFGALVQPVDPLVQFYTSPLMIEFCFGMALCLLIERLQFVYQLLRPADNRIGASVNFAVWLAAIGLLVFGPDINLRRALCAFLVVALTLRVRVPRGIIGSVSLVLGDISYSVYLLHPFVINAASIALLKGGLLGRAPLALITVVECAIVALAGYASYRLIERPISTFLKSSGWYAAYISPRHQRLAVAPGADSAQSSPIP